MTHRRTLDSPSATVLPISLRVDDSGLLASYDAWQAGRSFSPSTIRRRRTSLRSLATFVAPLALTEATTAHVEEWVSERHAPRTRHAYRSDVASFFGWASKRGLVTFNPVLATDSIRVPKCLPRPVDPSLVPALIASAADADTRLMVALAALAGLRRSEIAHLSSEDVSLHSRPPVLAVRNGKGSKDRLVPLHPILVSLLLVRGRDGPLFHISPDAVSRRVSIHLARCGVTATCHQLRHSFGTELARVTGGNLVLVGALMGHSDTNTTKGYVGWAGGEGSTAVSGMYDGVA